MSKHHPTRTRRRRGRPRGAALGFHGVAPATTNSSTSGSQASTPSTSTPSAQQQQPSGDS